MEILIIIAIVLIANAFRISHAIDKRYANKVAIEKSSYPYRNKNQYVWKDGKPAFKLDSKYYK